MTKRDIGDIVSTDKNKADENKSRKERIMTTVNFVYYLNQCHLVSSLESPRHLTCEVIISMIYGRFLTLSDKMIQLEYFRV